MAYPSVRSSRSAETATTVTSHTVTLPATVVAGDYLFVAFSCDDNAASPFTAITWDNSSAGTWTQLYSSSVAITGAGGGAALQEVWYKVANGTESSVNLTVTLSLAQPSTYYTASIQNCTGIVAGTPSTNSNTATSTPDPPALTTGWGAVETLYWVFLAIDNGTATTVTAYPSNYTDNQGIIGSGTGTARTTRASRNLTAGSDDPGTFTLDNSRPIVVNTIAFKPVPVGLSITSVTPSSFDSGIAGIVIAGAGFGASQGSSTVDIGGQAQSVTAWSDTSITITSARGSNSMGAGQLKVTIR